MPRPPSLLPREHGAYGELGFPLVAALAMGRPRLASMALAGAAVAGFLAHEPLLVILGYRGRRVERDASARARRNLALLTSAMLSLGLVGVLLGGPSVGLAAIAPITLTAVAGVFIAKRAEKTLAAEVLVALALSGAAVPVAVASRVPPAWAFGAWTAWGVSLIASTTAVRAVIANARRALPLSRRVALAAIVCAFAASAVAIGSLPVFVALAPAASLVLAVMVLLRPPPPSELRRVGWSLAAASTVTTIVLVAGAHVCG